MLKHCAFVPLLVSFFLPAPAWAQNDASAPSIPPGPKAEAEVASTFNASIDLENLLDAAKVLPAQGTTDGIWKIDVTPGRLIVRIPFTIKPGDKTIELTTSEISLRRGRLLAWQLLGDNETTTPAAVPLNDIVGKSANGLPAGVPRFARKLIIEPNGTITWEMERSITGAKLPVNATPTSNPYALKMNRDAMESLKPPKPPIEQVPEDPKARVEFAKKKREQDAQYRRELAVYGKLARAISKLPDEFSGKTPQVLWAVFELPSDVEALEFEGPTPLPWSIPLPTLKSIQVKSSGAAVTESNDAFATSMLATLKSGAKPHPFTLRLVAQTLIKTQTFKVMQIDDAAYQATSLILASKDATATGALTEQLALSTNDAAKKLFITAITSDALTAQAKLKALESLFSVAVATEEDAIQKTAFANQFLADANGPDPAAIVQATLEMAKKYTIAKKTLAADVNFGAIGTQRLEPTIQSVIQAAPSNELARAWLDTHLLDPNNSKLSEPTLTRLSAATLSTRIPVESEAHNLYAFLSHADSGLRQKAWQALSNIEMTTTATDAKWPAAIDAAALQFDNTPPEAVTFITRHKIAGLGDALARIVLIGDDKAAMAASKLLLQTDTAVDAVINRMPTIGDRYAFAQRLYQIRGLSSPLVVNLMRERGEKKTVTNWFASQLKSGTLPPPGDWVNAFGGEKILLEFMTSNDNNLALGALAALIAKAGGTDEQAIAAFDQFKSKKDSIQELLQLWDSTKQETFTQRLGALNGQYTLNVSIADETGKHVADKLLGKFAVAVQGAKVTIGPIEAEIPQDGTLAIRFKAGELARFPGADLKSGTSVDAIDLKPRGNAQWAGNFALEGGKSAKMTLVPAN